MTSLRFGEAVVSSNHGRDSVPASRAPKQAGARQERNVEAREIERRAEDPTHAILLPMAVGAVFLVVLLLGAIVG